MKHLIIFWIFSAIFTLQVRSQNITFLFNGINTNQETVEIDSVQIINLSNYTDTLVHGNTFTTLISTVSLTENFKNKLLAYPNPFYQKASINFYSNYNQQAKIAAFLANGQKIAEINGMLVKGENNIVISSGKKGLIIVHISAEKLQLTAKLICKQSTGISNIKLEANKSFYSESLSPLKSVKNKTTPFKYELGDSLQFNGYSSTFQSETIKDKPTTNQEYTLTFNIDSNKPIANFLHSADTINQGSSIIFSDLSTNNPTKWKWNFGDGDSSLIQNPSHTYLIPGNYSVSLIVSNNFGSDTLVKPKLITVNSLKPEADFSSNLSNINQGEAIVFTDQSTNSPTNWLWDFGDGSTSVVENPTHTFLSPGTYTVSLTVSNDYGSSTKTKQNYIVVNSLIPLADFNANKTSIIEGESIIFSDLSTNSPTSWAWDFGDGNTSSDQNPEHIYTASGMYSVALIAANNFGSDTILKNNYIEVIEEADPQLSVTPVSLNFDTTATVKSIYLTNTGGGTVVWSVSEELSWLSVDILSGETQKETDQITFTIDREGLSAGQYSGTVNIESNAGNAAIAIQMRVKDSGQSITDTPKEPGWE